MGKLANIIPVSDLRQDAAKIMQRMRNSREPVVITQHGRAAAVLISFESYIKSEEEKNLLRLLATGERNIESEEGYDLETVLLEADRLLADASDHDLRDFI